MTFDEITRKLTPSEGLYLSQKVLADESQRIFSELMFLGISDTPDNYVEKIEEEKQEWEREHPQPKPDEPAE